MTESPGLAPCAAWLCEPMSAEVARAVLRLRGTAGVSRVALMPDLHLAHGVCVGTAFASREAVFPEAVGSDIGCGMAAIRLRGELEELRLESLGARIQDGLRRLAPIRAHPLGTRAGWLPAELDPARLSHARLARVLQREGAVQFGTLGRGNHFLELQVEEGEDRIWLLVHTGSRALGQAVARHHLGRAKRAGSGLLVFEAARDEGRAYLADARFAEDWARANRARILEATCMLLGELCGLAPEPDSRLDAVHNSVHQEEVEGRPAYVHRKGTNRAGLGETTMVPGSMGTPSYHVEGRGVEEALRSCAHGAGRRLSRGEARRRITRRQLEADMRGVWFNDPSSPGLVEEAPAAYRDIELVMRAQAELVRRLRRLRPILCHRG